MSRWLYNFLFILGLAGVGIIGLFLLYYVHRGLEYCCLRYALRFCRRSGFEIRGWRVGPAFDTTGVKTEFTLVELDCLDAQKQRKLVRLIVWVFGIRKVLSTEDYPESQDETVPSA